MSARNWTRSIVPGGKVTTSWEADQVHRVEYEVTVRQGPGVSVYVLEQSELRHVENGNNFKSFSDATNENVSWVQNAKRLSGGEYGLLVSNKFPSAVQVEISCEVETV